MKKLSRRDFLKITGSAAAGAALGTLAHGIPFRALKNLALPEYVPADGRERFVRSICTACPSRCSVTVRLIGERAVRLEAENSSCAMGPAPLQALYHPERILMPLKRKGAKGRGELEPVSWEEALSDISNKLHELIASNRGGRIGAICGSSSAIGSLLYAAGGAHICSEPDADTLSLSVLGGKIDVDFDMSDYILCFESLGSNPDTEALRSSLRSGKKLVVAGALCTPAASLSSEWLPIRPGTGAALALGMANHIFKSRGRLPAVRNIRQWMSFAESCTLSSAAAATGISEDRIASAAEDIMNVKAPAALCFPPASSEEIAAVYALNSAANSPAVSLVRNAAPYGRQAAASGLDRFISEADFEMLFTENANPVYKSVLGQTLAKKMNGALVIAAAPFLNDTAMLADYVLPLSLPAEELVPPAAGPAKGPLSAEDLAAMLGERLGKRPALRENPRQYRARDFTLNGAVKLSPGVKTTPEYPVLLVPVAGPLTGDDSNVMLPFVLKAADGSLFENGRQRAHIGKSTAERLLLKEGQRIGIATEKGEAGPLYVHITDTIPPDIVGVPMGFGHTAKTAFAASNGINPISLMNPETDSVTGEAKGLYAPARIILYG